jgi:hypothetical protein
MSIVPNPAGSISSFRSKFKKDPVKANRFVVQIPYSTDDAKDSIYSEWLCHTAQLPGKTFATLEQKTYGPIEKFPYLATYNDIDLTFYIDGDMILKEQMDGWMKQISNPTGGNDIAYRKEFARNITIYQYNEKNNPIYSVILVDAYPISMNQLDLDWSSENFHNLSVTFAYTYWEQISTT